MTINKISKTKGFENAENGTPPESKINLEQNIKINQASGNEDKPKKKPIRSIVEEYLNGNYEVRFNIVLGRCEWKEKGKSDFKFMEDYDLNTMQRHIEKAKSVNVSLDKISNTLQSDYAQKYDPFMNYFDSLKPINGIENIAKLASTVSVKDKDLFQLTLTKWLVSAVANAVNIDGCQNQTCLVLTGEQGAFKTTWLELLTPKALDTYKFCGKINMNLESKDTLVLLAEKFIINLDDQLKKLNKSDSETMKTLISQAKITTRKSYGRYNSELPRRASFCGSINGREFLTDSTGSRRYLPFEVFEIDIKEANKIYMDSVWSEAYLLYKSGYQYYFTIEEIKELFKGNEDFQENTIEYNLVLENYSIPKENEDFEFASATQIMLYLECKGVKLNLSKIGEALKKLGFVKYPKRVNGNPIYGYNVRRILRNPIYENS